MQRTALDGEDSATPRRPDDEIDWGDHVDQAPHRDRYRGSTSPGRKTLAWAVVVALVVGAAAVGYVYWSPQREDAQPEAAAPSRTAPEAAPERDAGPAIRHPIADADAARAETGELAAPLPTLDESDGRIGDALAGIADRGALGELLNLSGVVRRVVVTVDNLPRKKISQRLSPLKPIEGRFLVAGGGDAAQIAPDNGRRYEPLVRVMESVDTGRLAALYVRFYPLFQQAYRDLGYPNGYFNDRLVEVIDHLLVTPEIDGPIKLARPWVMYEFADPALEARSAGQKTLIRMGPANALRVKAKLRELRRQIAGRELPR